jgi:LuxR family transcriptional regulator, maltose regulon positive regulatory protein
MSLTEIAGELYVSPNTVKTHTQSLYRKLGARSRTEALQLGRQRSLI